MIYAFKPVGQPGPIKIEASNQPLGRMASALCWSPLALEMIFSVDGGFVEERRIHHFLRDYRLHGEWFSPEPLVLQFVDSVVAQGRIPKLPDIGIIGIRSAIDTERLDEFARKRAEGWTLQRIGDEYGITRERVRQILASSGLNEMRQSMRIETLADRDIRAKKFEDDCWAAKIDPIKIVSYACGSTGSWLRWKRGGGSMTNKTLGKLEAALEEFKLQRQAA